ncbi:sigma-70 family RNA polymerase sigma factor [Singulisphaera acidiphila]|uniref:RNA polymerase sigma-70 factor, TIGR02957 family n=1 Tax=Singulisphaera acidiphila (strain ATCC BAA-1392 / DSM 18658 / VKM B-2454 / MOB10) TaxID=886293 RepID=L0DE44_SINAD|nr:sigma-70 family RNA polymerase sigma factor [Singulisphaera acidiphila]AGA27654.1 RNA polymerase sigma-70 factor, TIGR02957 family [Singulisphaera acidiphila DSM 18658]
MTTSKPEPIDAGEFESQRRRLTGLAYRMLGSVAEAEDVVQEAYLRWHAADRAAIADPPAFLSTVVTRLCLDQIKSARSRREHYIGPWLPEPVLDDEPLGAETASDYAHELSMTLMLALERLSPLERAAFLLHDVFDIEFGQVARTLGRSEPACRQLAARARAHVKESQPRFPVPPETGARLAEAFLTAARSGDAETLTLLLAEDAVLSSDGGGKRLAALRPIFGRDKITRFFVGLASKYNRYAQYGATPTRINGQPGFIVTEPDGSIHTMAVDLRDGLITSIYVVRNPDKLKHLARP